MHCEFFAHGLNAAGAVIAQGNLRITIVRKDEPDKMNVYWAEEALRLRKCPPTSWSPTRTAERIIGLLLTGRQEVPNTPESGVHEIVNDLFDHLEVIGQVTGIVKIIVMSPPINVC